MAHRGSSADSLPVVVGRVGPPVGLGLDIPQDHVLNRNGQTRHLGERRGRREEREGGRREKRGERGEREKRGRKKRERSYTSSTRHVTHASDETGGVTAGE